MNIEYEINQLKKRLDAINNSLIAQGRYSSEETSAREQTTNELDTTNVNVDTNTANIDYLAMMTDVDIPTESEEDYALTEV